MPSCWIGRFAHTHSLLRLAVFAAFTLAQAIGVALTGGARHPNPCGRFGELCSEEVGISAGLANSFQQPRCDSESASSPIDICASSYENKSHLTHAISGEHAC